jgi:hypothetical protein
VLARFSVEPSSNKVALTGAKYLDVLSLPDAGGLIITIFVA